MSFRSRLIVLSLPSDLSSEDLAGHFASLDLPVTDARVLHKKDGTSRRMGFIGYRTTEEAQKAKDWFDGTWIQGSRIKVDFAKEVCHCLQLCMMAFKRLKVLYQIGDVAPPRKRNRQYDTGLDPLASSTKDVILRPSANSGLAHPESTHVLPPSPTIADGSHPSTPQSPTSASREEVDGAESDAAYLARRMTREVGSEPATNDDASLQISAVSRVTYHRAVSF